VSILHGYEDQANKLPGLKGVINSDGVWRIQRKDRSNVIQVFKTEIPGYGKIISEEFLNWRRTMDIKPS
jgi:RAT1-interacting protein